MAPQIVPITEQNVKGTIAKIAEEGRFLTTTSDAGQDIRLRTAGDTVFEGVARSLAAQGRHEGFRAST